MPIRRVNIPSFFRFNQRKGLSSASSIDALSIFQHSCDKIVTTMKYDAFHLEKYSLNQWNYLHSKFIDCTNIIKQEEIHDIINLVEENSNILMSSTMKKRRAKMNKHKLKKRSKKMRKNTKISRS